MSSCKKILVTGGSGFLGSYIVKALKLKGYYVNVLARPETITIHQSSDVTYYHHDGTIKGISRAMKACSPCAVINAAGVNKAVFTPDDANEIINANCTYPSQVMAAAVECNCKYFINIGSFWQFSPDGNYNPYNLYAAAKHSSQNYLDYYHQTDQLKTLNLILYDTYGLNDKRPKLMNSLKNAIKKNEPLLMTSGFQPINLIHIEDASNAIVFGLESLIAGTIDSGRTYAIRGDVTLSVRDLIAKISIIREKTTPVIYGAIKGQNEPIMEIWEGEMLPGFNNLFSLESGLKQFFGVDK